MCVWLQWNAVYIRFILVHIQELFHCGHNMHEIELLLFARCGCRSEYKTQVHCAGMHYYGKTSSVHRTVVACTAMLFDQCATAFWIWMCFHTFNNVSLNVIIAVRSCLTLSYHCLISLCCCFFVKLLLSSYFTYHCISYIPCTFRIFVFWS